MCYTETMKISEKFSHFRDFLGVVKMHCILINSNNFETSEIYSKIQRNLSLHSLRSESSRGMMKGGRDEVSAYFLLSQHFGWWCVDLWETFQHTPNMNTAEETRNDEKRRRESKYHLLKSYDYDIIYSPVFVAIYVCQSPKICININFTSKWRIMWCTWFMAIVWIKN